MSKVSIFPMDEIKVTRVRAENGPAGSKKAFGILESRMSGLKGRKMYGVYYPKTDEYFACVMLDSQFPDDMGFEKSTIPGGKYARKKIEDWPKKVQEIASTFKELGKDILENNLEIGHNRPSVEFYRSFRELICMLPVK